MLLDTPILRGDGISHTEEVARSDGGVENSPSSAGLYWAFNPLARWALPLYRYAAQGERAKMRFEYFKLLHCRVPVALWSISVSLSETFKTPPLCFVTQNIGEVARSDGGVRCDKVRLGNGKRFLYRRLVNDPFAPMTLR